jgi:RNA polymerase sigma factor (TIGR02999 family)
MSRPDSTEVTLLLEAWRKGDSAAPAKLMPLVYNQLKRIARRQMAQERAGHTLQTTALVNEAYLRVMKGQAVDWSNRVSFFAIAAQVMRHLLVDHARRRDRMKRGAGGDRLALSDIDVATAETGVDVLALHEALTRLAAFDPRKSQLVELRYFGGLNVDETAEALGLSPVTVKREWAKAKAWLYKQLQTEKRD